MAKSKNQNDISKLSFEQAIKELTQIVGKIEGGRNPLEESIEQYERGMELVKRCRSLLQSAQRRIEKIAEQKGPGEEARNS